MVSIPYIQMHTISLYTWLFHTCHLFNQCTYIASSAQWQWPVSELPSNLRKVYQITLTFPRSKVPICILPVHTTPTAKFCWIAQIDLKITLTRSRSRVSTCILHTLPETRLSSVLHHDDQSSSHSPILCKRFTEWPKWPWHVQGQKCQYTKVKSTITNTTHLRGAQICFTRRWAVFGLRPNLGKSAPNDPKIVLIYSTSKSTHMHTTHP